MEAEVAPETFVPIYRSVPQLSPEVYSLYSHLSETLKFHSFHTLCV
jgi:hypothetical protein